MHPSTDVDVIIVGAGHNGLVAAWYLARAGLGVHMFERRPFIGGAAITEELWPGYRFSTCAHMVHAIHPKIIADLRLQERGFTVLPRGPVITLNPDGTYYGPAEHDSPRNRAFDGRRTRAERDGLRSFQQFKHTLAKLAAPYRLRIPPTLTELRLKAARTCAATVFEDALTLTASQVRERYLPTATLLDQYAAELAPIGRDPLALSYAYAAVDQPDEATGQHPPNGYVSGGMGAFSGMLADAAKEVGVVIHVGESVERFLVDGTRVIGVRTATCKEVRSRIVLSNLDPKRTFLRLLEPQQLDRTFHQRIARLDTQVSCVKFLAALSEPPDWTCWDGEPDQPWQGSVGLHRSRAQVAQMYDDLEAGRPPREMVISFSMPSAVDPSLAPDGHHTASCWILPAPARLRTGTWSAARQPVAERIIDQITAYAPNFRRSILAYKLRTPEDLERENGLTDGSIWHVQHNGEQLLWNRPLPELAQYRAPLNGLYLCGSGQHPGGEVSGLPGHNAAHEALKDLT